MLSKALQMLVPAVAACCLLFTAAQAQSDGMITTTKTAVAGSARAELSYQSEVFPSPLAAIHCHHSRLKLVRDGRTLLDEPLPSSEKGFVQIQGPEVRDLDGDGDPEILLKVREDFEQPGFTLIYRYDPSSRRYILSQRGGEEKLEISSKLETSRAVASRNVQAEISFREDIMVEGEVRLKLTRNGRLILDGPVTLGTEDDIASAEGPAIIDLDGDGEPEVILGLFSRGAYCCAYTIIYHYVAERIKYARLKHCWGPYRNSGVLKDIGKDGVPKFVCRNESFGGEFGPHAFGPNSPIQIWRYRQGRMEDVTRRYPKLIREDAQGWWRGYPEAEAKEEWGPAQMILAAYLADMHMLGEGTQGWKRVRQVYRGEEPQQFFRNLRQALKRHGYAR